MSEFSLTEDAARRIAALVSEETGALGLRVAVSGGGCSGFQYEMKLVKETAPDDLRVELDGGVVFIDPVSLPFLKGGTLDFVDDLGGSYFNIQNPNATSSCGCGNSFSA